MRTSSGSSTQRLLVDDGADERAVALPAPRRARTSVTARPDPGPGSSTGRPSAVTYCAGRLAPEEQAEGRVAERVGQRVAQLDAPVGVVERLDELADRPGAAVAAADEAGQEGVGQDREGRDRGVVQGVGDARCAPAVSSTTLASSRSSRTSPVTTIGRLLAALGLRGVAQLAQDQDGRGPQAARSPTNVAT